MFNTVRNILIGLVVSLSYLLESDHLADAQSRGPLSEAERITGDRFPISQTQRSAIYAVSSHRPR
jgi:hypothetical protein